MLLFPAPQYLHCCWHCNIPIDNRKLKLMPLLQYQCCSQHHNAGAIRLTPLPALWCSCYLQHCNSGSIMVPAMVSALRHWEWHSVITLETVLAFWHWHCSNRNSNVLRHWPLPILWYQQWCQQQHACYSASNGTSIALAIQFCHYGTAISLPLRYKLHRQQCHQHYSTSNGHYNQPQSE